MSAYHTYGSTSLGWHILGPQHKNMAQHLQHVTIMISRYQIYGWKFLMFQFPTDTIAKSMHEKKQIQSHTLHQITLTLTNFTNYAQERWEAGPPTTSAEHPQAKKTSKEHRSYITTTSHYSQKRKKLSTQSKEHREKRQATLKQPKNHKYYVTTIH